MTQLNIDVNLNFIFVFQNVLLFHMYYTTMGSTIEDLERQIRKFLSDKATNEYLLFE